MEKCQAVSVHLRDTSLHVSAIFQLELQTAEQVISVLTFQVSRL